MLFGFQQHALEYVGTSVCDSYVNIYIYVCIHFFSSVNFPELQVVYITVYLYIDRF